MNTEFSELDVDFLNLTKVANLLFHKRLEGHFLQWILVTAALPTNQLISLLRITVWVFS